MRRRLFLIILLGIPAALLVVLLVCVAWPGRSTYSVSPETTYVTGPLDKHGYIDYVSALNERLREGVTPENNANVLLWQALGPRPEGAPMHPEYFQWLGIESPPEQGEYLITWRNYMKEQLQKKAVNERDARSSIDLSVPVRPWTAKEKPDLAGWLKRNEKPLALVTEATHRPKYYNPLVPKRTEDWSPGLLASLLPNVQRCREIAVALASRALLRVAEGKVDEAWSDLLTLHRLGRLVAHGGTLIEKLVGFAIEQVAVKADLGFLEQAKTTSKQVLACREEWQKLLPMPGLTHQIDTGDRFVTLEIIMLAARYGVPFLENLAGSMNNPPKDDSFTARLFTRSINWDPAFRNVNRWYDRFVAVLRIPDRSERSQEIAALVSDVRLLKKEITDIGPFEKMLMGPNERGEMIGNIIIGLMLPAFDKVQDAADRGEQTRRSLMVAFALAAHHRDMGCYPVKLNELVPKYAKSLPDDLFSGRPLIYRQEGEGYLLYSVGLNGLDDDGREVGDEPHGDDLSIRLPVREPRGGK